MTKKMWTAIAVAAMVGVASFAAVPARAEVPKVPDDVAAWFKNQAADIVNRASSSSRDVPADPTMGPNLFPFGSSVGKPVAVMIWGDDFLAAANPTADMLVSRSDWMAPITAQGQPVGTLTAEWSADGTMGWMLDPNADQAAALAAARPSDIVASDGRNGLFIVAANTARQYGLAHWGILPVAGSLKQLQGAILAQRSADKAAEEAAGGPVTGAGPFALDQWAQQHPDAPAAPEAPVMPVTPEHPAMATSPWRVALPVTGVLVVLCLAAGALLCRQRRASTTG